MTPARDELHVNRPIDATIVLSAYRWPIMRSTHASGLIRGFRPGDRDELLDVWFRASKIAHSFLPDEFFTLERTNIAEQWLPIAATRVYESDGHVVGFLSLVGNEVGAVFVDPDHQGRGIGRALMDDARDARPYLELGVLEANASGRGFYRRYGFVEVGRQISEATGLLELRLRLG